MKKKIIVLLAVFVCLFACVFAVSISAENEPTLEIKAYNLTYGNSVYISYAISSENIPEGAKVQLLVWDKPQEEYIKGTEFASSYTNGQTATVGGKACQVFVFNKIIARQMATDFYAVAYVKTADGEYYSAPTKYSVLQYVYNKLGYTGTASNDEVYKELLRNTLIYGASAQKYFAPEDTRLADADFYQITVSGGTLPDGFNKGLYLEGDKLALTAPETDAKGNTFSHWEDVEKNSVSTSLSYEITVGQYNESYTAVYEKISRGLEYDSNGDGTCYVVGMGTCTDTEVIIPETTLGGDSVIGIDSSAFANSAITSITIPVSVVEIGRKAFSGCTSLTNVYYGGLSEEWENVTILTGNEALENANIHFTGALEYNVTFLDYDGTVISKETVLPGSYISEPQNLIREGYSLDGWYLKDIKWSFDSDTVTKNITLTARWSELIATEGLKFYPLLDGTYGVMAGNTMHLNTIIIPTAYNGKAVTQILDNAFENATKLKNVLIPNTIKSIGASAFSGCTNLESIEILNKVTSIGASAFSGCTSLTSIIIPDSVTYIGDYAFYDCTSLTNITIGNGVTSIGTCEFYGCTSLTGIAISNSVTSIGHEAFWGCSNFTSITLPDSVTYIGDEAFRNCTRLTSIEMSNSVTSIGSCAFYGCTSLTNITIPDSVTSIGNSVFSECTSLTSITIGNGVTSIGIYVFSECTSLTSITIGNGVTSIGIYVFSECTSLTSITIGNSVTSIGSCAFRNCTSLTSITVPNSVTSIGANAFFGCSSLESITLPFVGGSIKTKNDTYQAPFGYIFGELSYDGSVATTQYYYDSSTSASGITSNKFYIPSNLKSVTITGGNILYGAFYNCKNLTSITIPDSVDSIGSYAFYNCKNLTSITIPDSVDSIGSYAFHYCSKLTSITIPDDVDSIGSYTFYNCTSLVSVTIGDSVTSIGTNAFSNCTSLAAVYINDIAAWCGIEFASGSSSNPLYYAKNLYLNGELVTELVIPDSVTSIGSYAFSSCTSLTSVTIGNSVTSIGSYAFSSCTSLTSVTIGNSVTSIGSYAFNSCTNLTNITIPNSVTSIGSCAFSSCTNLTAVYISDIASWCSIKFGYDDQNPLYYAHNLYLNGELVTELVIPDSVTSIGSYAFSSCTSLTSVTIGNSVTSIGSYAFSSCTSLTSVTIGNSVTSIGSFAFNSCTSLSSVYISDVVAWCGISFSSYSSNPLYYAQNLYLNGELVTELVIPNNVTSIRFSAFRNCTSLASVTIGNSVTSIGIYAFDGCSALKNVYYTGTEEEWNSISIGSNNNHLINATIHYNYAPYTRDGNYIYFGEYPQTIKADDVTITDTIDSRGYYLGSDGAYYAKVTATPYGSGYTFSTGNAVTSGEVYYFKVEPIRWRILTEGDGKAFILCDSIIANKAYDEDNNGNYSNNYKESDIRAWLNNEFYNTAFTELQKELILTTTVDNSVYSTGYSSNPYACENTEDKIFLPSFVEVTNNAYGFASSNTYDTARRMQTSDYSRATGAWMSTNGSYFGNGYWWLRSPYHYFNYRALAVYADGGADALYSVYGSVYGIVPAMWITL